MTTTSVEVGGNHFEASSESMQQSNTLQEKVHNSGVNVEEKQFGLTDTISSGNGEGETESVSSRARMIYERCKLPLHILIGVVMTGYGTISKLVHEQSVKADCW
jgi:hypothetical protein